MASGGYDFCVSSSSFQKSNVGWPQQPPTEKFLILNLYFPEGGEEGEEDDPDEYVHVDEKYYYLEYIIRGLGITHAIVSFCMCIAYYNLKVPLAIFKREKEVARRLEFDGLYLAEQPEDDDMKGHWDKLVISAKYAIIFQFLNLF